MNTYISAYIHAFIYIPYHQSQIHILLQWIFQFL
jgi:hypothetical protein